MKNNANKLIDYYLKISKSKDLLVRQNAAFNLPCFFYYFGDSKGQKVYLDFAKDSSI